MENFNHSKANALSLFFSSKTVEIMHADDNFSDNFLTQSILLHVNFSLSFGKICLRIWISQKIILFKESSR